MEVSAARDVFETTLPGAALSALIEATGFQQRERRLDARALVRSSMISTPRRCLQIREITGAAAR